MLCITILKVTQLLFAFLSSKQLKQKTGKKYSCSNNICIYSECFYMQVHFLRTQVKWQSCRLPEWMSLWAIFSIEYRAHLGKFSSFLPVYLCCPLIKFSLPIFTYFTSPHENRILWCRSLKDTPVKYVYRLTCLLRSKSWIRSSM